MNDSGSMNLAVSTRPLIVSGPVAAPHGERMLAEFAAYLNARQRAASTIQHYVYIVRRSMRVFPDPFTVTATQLERYLIGASATWKPRTINSVTSSLRSFYRWAARFEYVTKNPAQYLENVRIADSMTAIADDEVVLDALPTCTPLQRAIILLGRTAGLRRSEIAGLHTSARQGDWLTITGKGGRVRMLQMQQELMDALDALDVTDGYYFPGRFGGHRSTNSIYAIVRKLLHTNPHALRHGAGTAVYKGTGHDIRATQVFLGHSSLETTQRYVHVDKAQLEAASRAANLTSRRSA